MIIGFCRGGFGAKSDFAGRVEDSPQINADLTLVGADFCQICGDLRAEGSENLRTLAKCVSGQST